MNTNCHRILIDTLSESTDISKALVRSGIPIELLETNSKLWELEHQAAQSSELVELGKLKREITSCNVHRHELLEAIDSLITKLYPPLDLPVYLNSETPGQVIDRMCIMLLRQKNATGNTHSESAKTQYHFLASILSKMLTAIEQRTFTIIKQPQYRRHFVRKTFKND